MSNGIIEVYEDDDAVYDLDQWSVDNAIDYIVQNIKADLAAGQSILEKYKELTRSAFEEATNDSKAIVKDLEIKVKNGSIDALYISSDDKDKLEKSKRKYSNNLSWSYRQSRSNVCQ